MISVKNLIKTYRSPKKQEGSFGIFKDFVNRQYTETSAVDSISFEIPQGELVGFVGPNGAGKTTTMKMLSGILYPSSGTIHVLGHVPFKKEYSFLRQIAFLMGQKNQLLWDLPAEDSFLLNKEIYEISDEHYKKTLSELRELLDVGDLIFQPVKTLSLGERMKMELIASLLHNPNAHGRAP
jgi:ABC-2 type transport system ATP-binding protein